MSHPFKSGRTKEEKIRWGPKYQSFRYVSKDCLENEGVNRLFDSLYSLPTWESYE